MLGINYNKIASNSVGYKSEFEMQSMDFEEFLWAKGYGQDLLDELLEHMRNSTPLNQATMNVMNELFLDYCILGGMPKVVRTYIEQKKFQGTLQLQKELIEDYKEDIKKYVEGIDKTKVLNVFNNIPVQLAKENKKFQRVIVNCCGLKKSVFFIRQPSFVHRPQKLYFWRQVQVV